MALRKDSYISNQIKTFEKDDSLPPLPVPGLKQTLEKYLESVLPFVSETELENTKRVVSRFHAGIGKDLHEELLLKAKNERNWVEIWWEKYAYLTLREPLVPFYSMVGLQTFQDPMVPLSFQKSLSYASLYCYFLVEFWKLLREQKVKPNQSAEKAFFTMKNFRNLYNGTRIPGIQIDSLKTYFKTEDEDYCPSHVVVLAQGRIFVCDSLDACGQPITPPEWTSQFQRILLHCDERGPGQGVSVLTNDNRTTWAKNRNWLEALSQRNSKNLSLIDTAVAVLALENGSIDCETAVMQRSLCGDPQNRWVDKSLHMIFFENSVVGGLCDHAQYDGMVSIQAFHYVQLAMKEINSKWNGSSRVRDLPQPHELEFDLDISLQQEILRIRMAPQDAKFSPICARENFYGYGKDFISKQKFHPDSFLQMALQLAYFRLHGRPAPTYETATTRCFYNGRTETLRSCTHEAVAWVKSMLSDKFTDAERKVLLEKAVNKHNKLMKEGKANAGCDRHLFGLQCLAMEKGLDVPEIFKDPAWIKSIHCSVTAWRGSSESSSHKFASSIGKSLTDMKKILVPSHSKL